MNEVLKLVCEVLGDMLDEIKESKVKRVVHFINNEGFYSFPDIFFLVDYFPKCIFAEGRRLDTTPSF